VTHESIEVTERGEEEAAVVRGHATTEELPAFLGGVFGEVMDQLGKQHVGVAGPPFARYRPTDDGFDVEAGFPAGGPVSAEGRVVPSVLPGGAVATTVHRGDYTGLGQTYSDVENWLPAHGYALTGAPWESYLDGPNVPEPRTQINFPCVRA
jgi:effector-binding domain-containing protein